MFKMRGSTNWIFNLNVRLLCLIGCLFVFPSNIESQSNKLPCNFTDSVNITAGTFLPNKAILFNDVEFAEEQYAELNYIESNDGIKVSVDPHIRGCLCDRKSCLRLCCPLGSLLEIKNRTSVCTPNEVAMNLEHEIIDRNNASILAKLDQHFSIVDSRPCKKVYDGDIDYQITHEGDILHEDHKLAHHQYCIRAVMNKTTNAVDLKLLVCFEPDEKPSRFVILPICMLISVLFIIATLFVYGCIPKLRNLRGKCVVCFLATLAIAYILLSYVQLNGSNHIADLICFSLAHLIYLSFLSAFAWSNVINFDLWLGFQSSSGFNKMTERKRFTFYSLYGFGLPCLLTVMVSIVDQIEFIPNYLRPRIATNSCFLHDDFLTKLLFFYLPLGIMIIMNIVLFILTTRRIKRVQREAITMTTLADDHNSGFRKTLHKKKEHVIMYTRLFVIAGITWILEVIGFLMDPGSLIFYVSDVWNCLQGVFIFILLIMRRRVLRLIKERWNNLCHKTNPNEDMDTNSNSSTNYFRLNSMTSPK